MHIEPHVVDGAKLLLSYATAAGSLGYASKLIRDHLKESSNISMLCARGAISIIVVLCLFQLLPHPPVGVSEVHLILGSSLFLLFGAAPAAIGLAGGLLIQGLVFAPFDLPQYGMNVTTLLAPLFLMDIAARKIISQGTAYKDIGYSQALKLSLTFQGGIVAWVGFWSFYGQGFTAENLTNVSIFASAYLSVILVEPIIDLALLYTAKSISKSPISLFQSKLYLNS
ncbi:energy-coupling factor ABC transporter permease [Vibrio viridaestus]|uniref:Cobalt transporter n=1 Tax=Vibrio viridaestus TaxID=2487322 RepID=A0A3N9TJM7_9VIBR|nr:energy-coupling factor ABC transporter permease [Vibrio viridaestus]RQW64529.1 cobalt transporter [Vibrio viridaestus]